MSDLRERNAAAYPHRCPKCFARSSTPGPCPDSDKRGCSGRQVQHYARRDEHLSDLPPDVEPAYSETTADAERDIAKHDEDEVYIGKGRLSRRKVRL